MIILHTNKGDIKIELDFDKAPVTAKNFEQYVKDGFYDGVIFHRVIKGFMIQGGGMDENMNEKRNARSDSKRSVQRPAQRKIHHRHGAHFRPAFRQRAILHQHRRQRLPELPF